MHVRAFAIAALAVGITRIFSPAVIAATCSYHVHYPSAVGRPSAFVECARSRFARADTTQSFFRGAATMMFRRGADGRLTFEVLGKRDGERTILVRGERVSTESFR